MSDTADMFKKLAQNRQKTTQNKAETKTESEIKSVPESKPPKKTKAKGKLARSDSEEAEEALVGRGVQALETSSLLSPSVRRKGMSSKTTSPGSLAKTSAKKTTPEPIPEKPPEPEIAPSEPNKKRGRPATGKRSDPDWIGRTFYIRKETDFDIEDELIKLKRAGINLDKSELVDFLLAAWVKWRKGENIDLQMYEISPRQKDELP